MQVVEQLPLGVQLRDEATFDNFYALQSQEVKLQVQLSAIGRGEQSIYLYGESGSGTSHLLQAACHEAQLHDSNSVYLPLEELVSYSPAVFESLEHLPLIALDNLQAIAGMSQWEEAVFHLFNRVRDNGGQLIMAANAPIDDLGIELADLKSRLQWGLVYELPELTEEDKMAALKLRAHNRGLELADDVAKYIVRHMNGNMDKMFEALNQLDKASLSAKRKVTRPFVKTVMSW
ncbi:DnaA regulatory inactivator Hda [Bermanella sp. R86510]|uniref:DnaA regulatory inactivator Hda n=1 Tax=unclassified Bermanella TaxID=2627862 RepID=UPI0037C52ECC